MANLLLTGCLLLSCVFIQGAYGFDCSFGSMKDPLDKFMYNCPKFIIDSSDESFCCYYLNDSRLTPYCCTFFGFLINLVAPLIFVFLVVTCPIWCVCCVCCRLCRRRGSVIQPPMVVTVPTHVMRPTSISSQPLLPGYNQNNRK